MVKMAKFLEIKDYVVPNTNTLVSPEREVCLKKKKKKKKKERNQTHLG